MTCKQGDQHRWDESRSRCLDCGREAAEIADELTDWLGEKEDWIDHMGDQIEALRAAEELEQERGQNATTDEIRAFLAEWDATSDR